MACSAQCATHTDAAAPFFGYTSLVAAVAHRKGVSNARTHIHSHVH